MDNQFTIIHLNGKYYVYTVTHINEDVYVNIEKINATFLGYKYEYDYLRVKGEGRRR